LQIATLVKQLTRVFAAKILEVSDHMHLIEISVLVGDTEPRAGRGSTLCIECHLKSGNSSEEFRGKAHFLSESTLILSHAQGCVKRQIVDPSRPFATKYILSTLHDRGTRARICRERQQILLDNLNSLGK
jgi:hypothetical protein